MIIGIMQPYFFPYIGYWQLIKAVDRYVVYDDVNFIKGGWINRNNFLINREKKVLTIALNNPSPNKLINEIEIKDDFRSFFKSIQFNYSRAPYYNHIFPILKCICDFSNKNLSLFLLNSIQEILAYLNIKTEIILSSHMFKNSALKGKHKVIHICKLLGGDTYINSIGGQSLYDKDEFEYNGIKIYFLQSEFISYKQFNNTFIPFLSILDVMMFNSPHEINNMLDKYTLF
jgi:hypothetical protein